MLAALAACCDCYMHVQLQAGWSSSLRSTASAHVCGLCIEGAKHVLGGQLALGIDVHLAHEVAHAHLIGPPVLPPRQALPLQRLQQLFWRLGDVLRTLPGG